MGDVRISQEADAGRTFEALLREHKNRIFGYICRLTNDSPDAEDLAQEVFIRAYQSMSAFRHDAAVDTWLYRIATNLVIDRHRRQKRAPIWVRVGGDPEEDAVLSDLPSANREADPASSAQLTELQRHVQRAVHSLPPKLRAVVVLYDMEGLSYEEVAQTIGCPLGTVKSRLFHARAMLKNKLERYMDASEGTLR